MGKTEPVFYVCNDEASELGLKAPMFETREMAEARRDEWNQTFEGHYVVEIQIPPKEECDFTEQR